MHTFLTVTMLKFSGVPGLKTSHYYAGGMIEMQTFLTVTMMICGGVLLMASPAW
jgi:hypothetical protein